MLNTKNNEVSQHVCQCQLLPSYFDSCELGHRLEFLYCQKQRVNLSSFFVKCLFYPCQRRCQFQMIYISLHQLASACISLHQLASACISQPPISLPAVHKGLEREKKVDRISIRLLGTDQELYQLIQYHLSLPTLFSVSK